MKTEIGSKRSERKKCLVMGDTGMDVCILYIVISPSLRRISNSSGFSTGVEMETEAHT